MEIDEADKKILNVLLENPRLSVRDIGKKTGYSPVTVLKRIKRLEEDKIIRSFTTYVDYSRIGYDIDVIVKVRVSKGMLSEVGIKIAQSRNVSAIYDITGDFDIMVIAKFKNRKSLDSFVKKLQTQPYVERTETILILNTLKEKFINVE